MVRDKNRQQLLRQKNLRQELIDKIPALQEIDKKEQMEISNASNAAIHIPPKKLDKMDVDETELEPGASEKKEGGDDEDVPMKGVGEHKEGEIFAMPKLDAASIFRRSTHWFLLALTIRIDSLLIRTYPLPFFCSLFISTRQIYFSGCCLLMPLVFTHLHFLTDAVLISPFFFTQVTEKNIPFLISFSITCTKLMSF